MKRHLMTLLACGFAGLVAFQSQALVPGPILLSDELVEQMQADTERQLLVPESRSNAVCLQVSDNFFCPGLLLSKAQQRHQELPADLRKRLILFYAKNRLQAALNLLPSPVKIPGPKRTDPPYQLGPEPVALIDFAKAVPGNYAPLELNKAMIFDELQLPPDLKLVYDSQRHLGLLLHDSEQGSYVIGSFVVQ